MSVIGILQQLSGGQAAVERFIMRPDGWQM
jgi:hypothetical protein